MATITVSTDTQFSSLSIVDNDIVSLTASARLTIDESTPNIRRWDCISDGEFYVENNSTTTPRFIHVGHTGTNPRIRLEAGGRWTCRGALIELGVSNGTANQTFTLPKDGTEEYQVLAGMYLDMGDTLLDNTPVPRLMARIDSFTDTFNHERLGAVFTHNVNTNTITLGDGTNGWIPPNGTKIYIPNIQIKCTNTSTAEPIFDLALSGRMDWEYVSVSGDESATSGFINTDFDNGAGQNWDHVCIESSNNRPINFNVNAGKVTLKNVVAHCAKEVILSSASVPPEARNLMILSKYTAANDYMLECFNNSGGEFENIVILAPYMSNGSNSRGAYTGTSANVNIYNMWSACPNPVIYFTTGSSNCTARKIHGIVNGKRGFTPATKTSMIRTNGSSSIIIDEVRKAIDTADGGNSHREAIIQPAYSKDVTVNDVIYDANGQMDHIVNDTASNTRVNNIQVDGQLLSRCFELGTVSSGLKVSNVKFSETQTNGTTNEFGFGTEYNQVMIKSTLSTAVGTDTDCTSNHFNITEDDTKGRIEMRMSPFLNEVDYYTEITKTGKIVFNQNNRLYIERSGDQIILTGRVHYGVDDFTSASKGGSSITQFDVECSMRRPGGVWTSWNSYTTANMSSSLQSLPSDTDKRIQLRYRITKNTNNLTAYLNYIYSNTNVDNTIEYPFIIAPIDIKVTNIVEGSVIFIYTDSGGSLAQGTVLFKETVDSSGEFLQQLDFGVDLSSTNQPIRGRIRNASSDPYYQTYNFSGEITSSGFSLTADQQLDK